MGDGMGLQGTNPGMLALMEYEHDTIQRDLKELGAEGTLMHRINPLTQTLAEGSGSNGVAG